MRKNKKRRGTTYFLGYAMPQTKMSIINIAHFSCLNKKIYIFFVIFCFVLTICYIIKNINRINIKNKNKKGEN